MYNLAFRKLEFEEFQRQKLCLISCLESAKSLLWLAAVPCGVDSILDYSETGILLEEVLCSLPPTLYTYIYIYIYTHTHCHVTIGWVELPLTTE